jgi:hypothetical protein
MREKPSRTLGGPSSRTRPLSDKILASREGASDPGLDVCAASVHATPLIRTEASPRTADPLLTR